MKILFAVVCMVAVVICGCMYSVSPEKGADDRQIISYTCFSSGSNGNAFPIFFRSGDLSGVDSRVSHQEFTATSAGNDYTVYQKGNICFAEVPASSGGVTAISIKGFDQELAVEESAGIRTHTIASTVWPDSLLELNDCVVFVTSNCTVSSSDHLRIGRNTAIVISPLCTIVIDGDITSEGSAQEPVIFRCISSDRPWGGLVINNGTGSFVHTAFYGGGGNISGAYVQGHSGSQAALHVIRGEVTIASCYFLFNAGKGVTSDHATVVISNSIFAFCDMGCEFGFSYVTIDSCFFGFLPNASHEFVDDDNDALYFYENLSADDDTLFSRVTNSTFYLGRDDAIDHNGAFLSVEKCWIEDFEHEGLAGSSRNIASIYDTYIFKCEQGVESGYGSPTVNVNHCLIRDCYNGLRFGDSYYTGCEGTLNVQNTVSTRNVRNLFNLDLKSGSSIDSAVEIASSVVTVDYDICCGTNYYGEVAIDSHLLLVEASAGGLSGTDGFPVGLVTGW